GPWGETHTSRARPARLGACIRNGNFLASGRTPPSRPARAIGAAGREDRVANVRRPRNQLDTGATMKTIIAPCACMYLFIGHSVRPEHMAQPSETIVDPRGTLDRWYVTNGVVALGPVSFDRLIQDAATGQLPPGALVRHQNWKVWRRLEELEALSSANRQRAVEELSSRSRGVEQRTAGALSEPPPPPPTSELVQRTSTPDTVVRASLRPVAVDPVGVLSSAERLEDALLLTLST